ncbi:MAG: hypothetical protein ACXACI_14320 [Candidatus Hodarchaeales archaeon]
MLENGGLEGNHRGGWSKTDLPICEFDAKTGMLCARCRKKKQKGKITDSDIRASKSLVTLSQRFPHLQAAELQKAVKVDGMFILGVTQKSLSIFQDANLIHALEKDLRGTVKPVALTSDYRVVLSSLFSPLEVLGVDKVFVPDGSQELKVRLRSKAGESDLNIELLCKMAGALLNLAIRADLVSDVASRENGSDEPEY